MDGHTEDIITPERAAKGDLRLTRSEHNGRISHAEPRPRYVVDWLVGRGTLSEADRQYGVGLLELRHAFLSPVDPRAKDAGSAGPGDPATRYLHVTREIGTALGIAIMGSMFNWQLAYFDISRPTTNIDGVQWGKLIVNLNNALNALADAMDRQRS